MPNPLPPGTSFAIWLGVELQFFPTANQLDIDAGLVQEPRPIERGGSAPYHDDPLTLKAIEFVMAATVREHGLWQVRQFRRSVFEMRDAHCENHVTGFERFAVVKPQDESTGH